MSHDSPSATDTLLSLLESAKTDLAKALKDVERATSRKAEAELRVKTLEEAYDAVRGGVDRSVRDYILEAMRPETSYSAAELLDEIKRLGYRPNPKNPTAAVIVTAGRLVKEEKLTLDESTSPHRYRMIFHSTVDGNEFH